MGHSWFVSIFARRSVLSRDKSGFMVIYGESLRVHWDISKPYITAIKEVCMSSKRYLDEPKTEKAKQVIDQGRSVRDVSSRLGVSID
jgi:hypothetical protein